MNHPSPEFARKLAHAALIVGNMSKGMLYTQANADSAFNIVETARRLGYAIPGYALSHSQATFAAGAL